MATLDTVATAQAIYAEVYGDIDDKGLKASKMTEIHDWLEEGDLRDNPTVDELAAEWREYDAEDVAARGV